MRLTWRRADGEVCPRVEKGADIHYIAGEFTQKVYDKLAAYEDAEEQGRLVILPCKVGDTVYYITGYVIYKAKAKTFRFNKSGIRVYCERNFMGVIGFEGIFGKTVFLTREEAEAALKGGQDDV